MTVLDLDPPRHPLRLVVTNNDSPTRDHRYRDHAALHGDARALYREVLQWALECGESISADALRVVLAVKHANASGPIRHVTAAEVWQLLFVDVVSWCRHRKLEVPPGCTHALEVALHYLDQCGSFANSSTDLDELLETIDECTGGWSDIHSTSSPTRSPRWLRSSRGPKRP